MIPQVKSRQLDSDVTMTTVKSPANRENVNLLLFYEPQQIAIFTLK